MQRFEEIGCIRCHNGPMFSDYKLHVMGVPDNPALPASDGGAQEASLPGISSGAACSVPSSVRQLCVARRRCETSIYLPIPAQWHVPDMSAVVGFYESTIAGKSRNPNVSYKELDPRLRELKNVDEDVDLIEFLYALSDGSFDRTIPERVRAACPSAEEFDRASTPSGMLYAQILRHSDWRTHMKPISMFVLGVMAVAMSAPAQAQVTEARRTDTTDPIQKPLLAARTTLAKDATVIKWIPEIGCGRKGHGCRLYV